MTMHTPVMHTPVIRPVTKADLPRLDTALRGLSADLGDAHATGPALLEQAVFGAVPACHALIAVEDGDRLRGAVVFSAFLSTSRGGTGLYVSDLWVSPEARGAGLGHRLLARAARAAHDLWGARCLKLAVYADAPDARRFYDRLGFAAAPHETSMYLEQHGFETLKGHA